MSLRRRASSAVVVGAAFAIVLAASAPTASALGEADGLYSIGGGDEAQFVQLDTSNAAATPLGSSTDLYVFEAVEVVNGLGYAIGDILGPDPSTSDDDVFGVFTWNIATGAVLTAVPLTAPFALQDVYALDTRTDGVLLTYTLFDDAGDELFWVSSINPTTGVVTPLIDLDRADEDLIFEGIATNPVDGITYLLADFDDGVPAASPVNFGTGTVGVSVSYTEIQDSLGDGYFVEGDFDETGVLWFTYSDAGVSRTDAAFEVAVDATELGDPDIERGGITIGTTIDLSTAPPDAPELAATGPAAVAPLLGLGLFMSAVGAAALVVTRRSRQA